MKKSIFSCTYIPTTQDLNLFHLVYGKMWYENAQLVASKLLEKEFFGIASVEDLVIEYGQSTPRTSSFVMRLHTEQNGRSSKMSFTVISSSKKVNYTIRIYN